jgi:hypothetical protein
MDIDKNYSPILSDKDNAVSISLPLCDKAYRDLYDDKADPILRNKELAFVVLTQHYNSSLVKQGLTGEELVEVAKRELGLSLLWKPSEKVLHAIQHFNNTNDSSIVKYVKNLHVQYNLRNKSIEIISKKIGLLQRTINSYNDTDHNIVIEKINQLVELEKALDALSKSVPEQVRTFNSALQELQEEEKSKAVAQGGGVVSDSMDPSQSIINMIN